MASTVLRYIKGNDDIKWNRKDGLQYKSHTVPQCYIVEVIKHAFHKQGRQELMTQLTLFQFQPNTSVAIASIRTFCFSVLDITIIYKTTFVMSEIHSCSVHHSIYDHFCSVSTMSPWKL